MADETTNAEHALEITRLIDAPRELVFRAWTERLPDWWGPHGMTTPECEMELRSGGRFRTVMLAPDGSRYATQGVFLDVVAPERIVFTDAFTSPWVPSAHAFMTSIATFEPEAGKTRYRARALHWSAKDRESHEAMGFADGWGQSADRFEAVIAEMKAAG